MKILRNTDWGNFGRDEIDSYIQTILSLRWHKENKKYFYHRVSIEGMGYTPRDADTNYGCVIINATNLKNIRAGFYTIDGKYVTAEEFVKLEQEGIREKYKMSSEEFKKALTENSDESFDKLKQEDYENLCNEMDELAKKKVIERLEGK